MTDNSRVRVSIIGVICVALFVALVGRLWFLQVGAGEEYVVQAEQRARRELQSETPRGRILDRHGRELVVNRVVWALTLDRELDEGQRADVLGRLAGVLGAPHTPDTLQARADDARQSPLKPAVLAVEIPDAARVAVLEHREEYPGVEVAKLTVRAYPNGRTASHLLGYVGEINEEELAEREGYEPGDAIGRAAIERAYEAELRGEPRVDVYEVDPTGMPVGDPIDTDPGRVGHDVRLTIDLDVQRAVEQQLAAAILVARGEKNEDVKDRYETYKAPAGAAVVLDVRDGSVVAMASFPDYDPAEFIGGITQPQWDALNDPANHAPLTNRAAQGVYAPGSTMKLVTSVALTANGIRGADQWIEDNGFVEIRGTDFQNASRTAHGSVDLAKALRVSSDVYYYTGGFEMWQRWKAGDEHVGLGLQGAAHEFGLGGPTGIELDEAEGTVPDPDWKRDLAYRIWDTEDQKRENAIWYPADEILMAVGQGGAGMTPLQLANAYAAFANGGTLWQPHLADAVVAEDGSVVHTIEPTSIRQIALDPYVRQRMLQGFQGAVAEEDGTAYNAFAGFPLEFIPVAGKTGTAQVQGKGDTSLFAGFFPVADPQYVVVAVVEEGGRGSRVAAPLVRRIIESMNGLTPAPVVVAEGVD